MNNQQRSFFFNVDWITVLIFLALCTVGLVNIYASVYDADKSNFFDFSTRYGKQLIYIISAVIIGGTILLLDGKFFSVFSPVIYGITILLLMLVLVIGRNVGGNQAWIPLGTFRLQPSEFAKLSTCLLLARYIGNNNIKFKDFKSILYCALIIVLPLILIQLQPDTGSSLVFISFIFPMYREGLSGYFPLILLGLIVGFVAYFLVPMSVIIPSMIAIAAFVIYINRRKRKIIITSAVILIAAFAYIFSIGFVYEKILREHQRTRIEVLFGLKKDLKKAGYNVNQSKIAIGSGQALGKGYLQGTQTKYGYVPEQSTDFIFSTVGEEWGFAGCSVVVGLYVFLLLRLINIAERQRSTFSRVYGYGVASILFFHFFINIGMTIGLVPVIGIPLPFISYGGSSLWSFTMLVFIMLKLDSNRMGFI